MKPIFVAAKFISESGYTTMSGIKSEDYDDLKKIPFVKEVYITDGKLFVTLNCGKDIEVEYLTEEMLDSSSAEEMYAEEVDALAVLITR